MKWASLILVLISCSMVPQKDSQNAELKPETAMDLMQLQIGDLRICGRNLYNQINCIPPEVFYKRLREIQQEDGHADAGIEYPPQDDSFQQL